MEMSNVSWFIDHSKPYLLASMVANASGFGGTAEAEFLGLFPIVLGASQRKVVFPLEECMWLFIKLSQFPSLNVLFQSI